MKEEALTTDPVKDALGQSKVLLHRIIALLEPHFEVLTPAARQHLPIVPNTFSGAAATMLEALSAKPKIASACEDFDAARVEAQLEYATLLAALANQVDQLKALVDDGLRTDLASAYASILPVYNTAKSASRYDTTLLPIVAPLEEVFSARTKARTAKAEPPKTETSESEVK